MCTNRKMHTLKPWQLQHQPRDASVCSWSHFFFSLHWKLFFRLYSSLGTWRESSCRNGDGFGFSGDRWNAEALSLSKCIWRRWSGRRETRGLVVRETNLLWWRKLHWIGRWSLKETKDREVRCGVLTFG